MKGLKVTKKLFFDNKSLHLIFLASQFELAGAEHQMKSTKMQKMPKFTLGKVIPKMTS